MLAVQVDGDSVVTVEGLSNEDALSPLQAAFRRNHALQCGFCTPGFIMAAEGLLRKNPNPSYREIKKGLGSNICRCTGYVKIIEAVQFAAEEIRKMKIEDEIERQRYTGML